MGKLLTAAGIAAVTYINCKSTKVGTYTNNVFTLSKVLALCLLVIMGFKTMVQGVNKNLESENMWAGTSTNIGDYAQACLSGPQHNKYHVEQYLILNLLTLLLLLLRL